MDRSVGAFIPMVPPSVTHNDLVPSVKGEKTFIRKSDRLKEAEDSIVARLWKLRPEGGPLDGPLSLSVSWCFPTSEDHGQYEPHTSKPDLSNMLKTFEDCLVRAKWIVDDKLIFTEKLTKAWSDPAGIYVEVVEMSDWDPLGRR